MTSRHSPSLPLQCASSAPAAHLIPSPDPLHDADHGDALLLDAAAAVAAAKLFNNHNAHAHSAIELCSAVAPPVPTTPPRLTSSAEASTTRPSTAGSTPRLPSGHVQFRTTTIAPSPPPPLSRLVPESTVSRTATSASADTAALLHGSTLQLQAETTPVAHGHSSLRSGVTSPSKSPSRPSLSLQRKTSASSFKPISRTPSLKASGFTGIFGTPSGASSAYPSPVISAMGDVTPLPSPLLACDSPGPWKKLGKRPSRDAPSFGTMLEQGVHGVSAGDATASTPTAAQHKKKGYGGLSLGAQQETTTATAGEERQDARQKPPQSHSRNRSISEYIPDPMLIPKRMVTVSGSHAKAEMKNVKTGYESQMRREPHLSEARGLTPVDKPPTPPPSDSSLSSEPCSSNDSSSTVRPRSKREPEYFEAYGRNDRKKRRWRSVKMLGQGTFSRVMLATSQISSPEDDEHLLPNGEQTPEPTSKYERRTLVAVKVCEHGPRGGASEDRIEMSLKRELEIMQSLHHPSLIHLKAWNIEETRAILVLSYCPGGDLFDVASRHRELLSPGLLRRIFAELVGVVRYLHSENIVHRDLKLENVLVNLPTSELASTTTNWTTYPYSVITLTDLGLSRRVEDDQKLETRCGSDDYAAPEVIMGQPYDGQATDAWSLGVLLYALLESRLPFDPHPSVGDYAMQMRMRSRTSHRIARVDWRWIEFGIRDGDGDGDGEHEADLARFDAKGLRGAMEVVEGLMKRARSRWTLSKVAETEWVSGGVNVECGIQFREEEEGEEVV